MAILNLIETIQTKLSTLAKKDGQLIVIRDNASLYVDLDGARIYISDWIDVATDEERLAMLSPLSNKYYYVVETNKIWRYISGSWVLVTQKNYEDLANKPSIEGVELSGNKTLADFGGKQQIRISWADFQALPTEEQNDESIVYYIYDYPSNVVNASDISYDNATSGLSADDVQEAVDELNTKVDSKVTNSFASERALVTNSDGKVSHTGVTLAELNRLSGVTSGIQTQLNDKLSLGGGTLTGNLNVNTVAPTIPDDGQVGSHTNPYFIARFNQFSAHKDGVQYGYLAQTVDGTASETGLCMITVGNNIPYGTAGNARGVVRIFNEKTYCAQIKANPALTTAQDFILGTKGGTVPTASLNGTTLTINL